MCLYSWLPLVSEGGIEWRAGLTLAPRNSQLEETQPWRSQAETLPSCHWTSMIPMKVTIWKIWLRSPGFKEQQQQKIFGDHFSALKVERDKKREGGNLILESSPSLVLFHVFVIKRCSYWMPKKGFSCDMRSELRLEWRGASYELVWQKFSKERAITKSLRQKWTARAQASRAVGWARAEKAHKVWWESRWISRRELHYSKVVLQPATNG